jgi:hypothetical protein
MECRFCYKSGHTVKYCKLAKNANNVRLQAQKKIKAPTPTPAPAQLTKSSFAAAFGSDDDDDSDQEDVLEAEEFPELGFTNANAKTAPLSFARIIPGTFDQLMAEKEHKQKMAKEKRDEKEMRAAVNVIHSQPPTTTPFKRSIFPMKSWADDSDFEDEEDIPRKEQTSFKPVECNDEW